MPGRRPRGGRCSASIMPAAAQSGGDFETQTLHGWRGDVLAMIDEVADEGPVVLVGSSMGGWLMLLAALARPERVAGLVGIAAAPDFTDWGFSQEQKIAILSEGRLEEPSPYGEAPYVTTRAFWESGEALRLLHAPIAIDCPVRLLHGQADAGRELDLVARADEADPFSGRADGHRQGRRPSAVARIRSRAAGRHRLDAHGVAVIPLLLAFVAMQAPSLPSSPDPMPPRRQSYTAPPSAQRSQPVPAEEARYRSCTEQVRANPEAAVDAANVWREQGGGLAARQCLGLAFRRSSAGRRRRPHSSRPRAKPRPRAMRGAPISGSRPPMPGSPAATAEHAMADFDAALLTPNLSDQLRGEVHLDRGRAQVALGNPAGGARRDRSRAPARPQ